MVRWLGHHATGAGAHHPHGDRRVTGRAAVGPRLWMQLVWGTVTVIFGLIEVAIIWTIIARYLPVADMGTLIQNMLQRKPLLVTE
mgnify:CR=1 FL=1